MSETKQIGEGVVILEHPAITGNDSNFGNQIRSKEVVRKYYKSNGEKIKVLPDVYQQHNCNITATCRALGITMNTFYVWLNDSPELREQISFMDMALIDDARQSLHKRVKGYQYEKAKQVVNKDGQTLTLVEQVVIEPSDIAIMYTLNNKGQKYGFNTSKVDESQYKPLKLPQYLDIESK